MHFGSSRYANPLRSERKAMAEVVNLNRARKRKNRSLEEERAQQNRLLHGRSKAEKKLNQAQSEAARRHLDAHHIKSGDDA
jgi:regulator of protease activity HflC (stomatin/prohibitin superfamily)